MAADCNPSSSAPALPRYLLRLDGLLRGEPAAREGRSLRDLFACILLFGFLYGGIMGTYGGVRGDRLLQVLYGGMKVPLLLLVTFVLSLPSFWVLNTLLGLAADFSDVLRALVSAQAALTLVLASLAPFTVVWYASTDAYHASILFNAAMFAAATFAAQSLLRRSYRPLIAQNPTHRWMLRLWVLIYAFVGIQMGWVLRPFLGHPDAPVQFFRSDSWGNAYEVVGRMVWEAVMRR